MIIVVCGPSGVGKGTIVDRLLATDPRLHLSRSWTTRPRRPGEPDDAYTFVDRSAFQVHAAAGGFLEWDEHFDHLYGTPIPDAGSASSDLLLEIDVNGAAAIKERHPDALVIYVAAPSSEAQSARLHGRGDPPEVVARRLARAGFEDKRGRQIADAVVVNDDLEQAVAEVAGILASRRSPPTAEGTA